MDMNNIASGQHRKEQADLEPRKSRFTASFRNKNYFTV
jgi:hypothetical protein